VVVEFDLVVRGFLHLHMRCSMGDKSPKSTERKKKQAMAEKAQKKSDAHTKSHPTPAIPGKKGK